MITLRIDSTIVRAVVALQVVAFFCATGIGSPRVRRAATASNLQAVDRYAEATATFLKLFDALDRDHDGIVPLADVFSALHLQKAEARQVKRVRAYDKNGDGKIARDEGVAAVRAEIDYQVTRVMNTDVDGDSALTPNEYALSFADPNGKADAGGLTPDQRAGFKIGDHNGDGKITREEIETNVTRNYMRTYWSQAMAIRANRVDRNGDGLIDMQELASLESAPSPDALSAKTRKRYEMAGGKEGGLDMQWLWLLYYYMDESERGEAEKRLEEFEKTLNNNNQQTTPKE
jgi:Ca2+-binding EF-hand superfamily protein